MSMSLPVYLALTGAEFPHRSANCQNFAYMACHFSPYGTGLSNLPRELPAGCLLILNDRIPVFFHDPKRICQELCQIVEKLGCEGILLDFQRPGDKRTQEIARAVVDALPCPVAVTECYARELSCPVFLCPPLYITPEESIAKWPGREIWLELGLWSQVLTLTEDGCTIGPVLPIEDRSDFFLSQELCCGYRVEVWEEKAEFTLQRRLDDIQILLNRLCDSQVTRAVGLYQELGEQW